MSMVTRRHPRWLILMGVLVAASPFAMKIAAQGRGGGAPPRPLINKPDNPLLQGFRWRSIGPVGQGARIDDFAVDEKNPSTYYIGYAVAGVWKTVNNGTTFEPIFSTYGAASIADLTLAPSDPNVLYVATGEANNRQTTSYGDGIYKSTNAGETFTKIGLENAQTLGRVIVHPKDPNIVWVAVGGHLYGPNPERGVYMTTDGGKTWNKTLYIDEDTGATEIVIDPANPQNLWAAMYQRRRTAWGFNGGGPGSGLYASVDGGKTWKRQSGNGLPNGTLGRIALDICKTNPNVLYAQIEVAQDKERRTRRPRQRAAPAPGGGRGGRGGRGGAANAGAAGAARVRRVPVRAARRDGAGGANGGGAGGAGGGRGGAPRPPNPQSDGIWKSIDHGKTWQFMNNENQRPMYFSQIRVDPNDANTIYVGGVNAQKSIDGGKTMFSIEQGKGHVDNHAIWIDPLNSKHLMYGDDGGLDVSWDGAETFESVRLTGTGLAYHASVGMGHPYMVCTGLQDNGSWCGPSSVRSTQGIRMWDWISVGGGDGFQNAIDPSNENIFITESQNAGIQRYDIATGEQSQHQAERPGPRRPWRWWWRWRLRCRPRQRHSDESPAGHGDPVQLERADPAVAARPERPLSGRSSALHLARPGHHLDDDEGHGQERRPRPAPDSGRVLRACRGARAKRAGGGGGGAGGGPGPATRASRRSTTATSGTSSALRRKSPNRRSSRGSSGPAPTTATCRSARTAA